MMNAKFLISKLVILYLVIFPFGQLGRFEVYSHTLHLVDIIVGIIALVYLAFNFSDFRQKLTKGTLGYFLVGFFVLAGFSLLINLDSLSAQDFIHGFLYLLRFLGYNILFFAVSFLLKSKSITNGELLRNLNFIGLLTSIFALVQYFLLPDTRVLKNFGWDDHYFRSIGTFLDPNFLGLILVLFTLFLFSQEWRREDFKSKIPLALLSLTALAFTFSRSSFIALVAGLFVINIVRRKVLLTIGVLLYFGICLYISPKPSGEGVNLTRSSTVYSRLVNYSKSIEVGFKTPLFGQGFNLLNWEQEKKSIDNSHSKFGVDSSLLFIFLTTGVVGLSTFIYLLLYIAKTSWINRISIQGLLLLSSLTSILIHSFFQNSLFYPWVLGWLMILLALVGGGNEENQKNKGAKG